MTKIRTTWNSEWPVLKAYDAQHLDRIAMPAGGIGTGTVSLGGRGDWRDWEIMNRPAKGFRPPVAFFALHAKPAKGKAVTRVLEGPVPHSLYEASEGSEAANAGLPRFRQAAFAAAYPLGQVFLRDPDVPLRVRLEMFNPLIPGDTRRSSLPVIVFRVVLINPSAGPVKASVCANLANFIGMDGGATTRDHRGKDFPAGAKRNVNAWRKHGFYFTSSGVPPDDPAWGTMALTTTAKSGISYRRQWAATSWGDSLLDFWDDFSSDGRLEPRNDAPGDAPVSSLAVAVTVPPGAEKAITFLFAWHFPNRTTWNIADAGRVRPIGNHYTTRYRDAWDVMEKVTPQLPALEAGTISFTRAFCDSDLPAPIKEAALFNLSTLRSQTCFRTPDGHFFGWEGCHDHVGSCFGSCTHVWNYEPATAMLFPELARSMREVEFRHATRKDGRMSFRVHLPLSRATDFPVAAADGQMGCIMKLYREWQLGGDTAWLKTLWPKVRAALAFCWIPGGWDADRDGVMEGCQHNTMDVEYYGPNPQMQGWYLGALRAAEEMARAAGDEAFARECRALYERGRAWTDRHLFNGDYYEHHIQPPATPPAPGLRAGLGAANLAEPELQLGAGCLVDQLAGPYMAHLCGLGDLLDPAHVRQTLKSIYKFNFKTDFAGHFNHYRSFVLGDDAGLLMATWPKGRRPKRPFPYCNEVMSGFEYTAAAGMLFEGLEKEALRCIRAIRARHDGQRRNPFNETECGYHYARAMASWAAVPAWTGFHYSAVDHILHFKQSRRATTWFWASGVAWGTLAQNKQKGVLRVLGGDITLSMISIGRQVVWQRQKMHTLRAGQALEF